jgi:hypothetical protein
MGRVREMFANVPIVFFGLAESQVSIKSAGTRSICSQWRSVFGKCHYSVAAWEKCGESENVPSFPKKKLRPGRRGGGAVSCCCQQFLGL